MKKFNQTLLAISILALSGVATAAQITGDVIFGGSVVFSDNTFDTNFVDIKLDRAIVTDDPTGDFADYVNFGDLAVYNDFTYDPFSVVSPLWTVGGFSFTLNQITYIDEVTDSEGHMFLSLAGSGVFTGNGFESTAGGWTFSSDGIPGDGSGTFAFSSVNAVPEPGVALLLGVGLIGFGVSRKLRRTA